MSGRGVSFETDQRGAAQLDAAAQKKLFSEPERVDEVWKGVLGEATAAPPAMPADATAAAPKAMEDAMRSAVNGMASDMVALHFLPPLEQIREQLATAESQKESLRKKLEEVEEASAKAAASASAEAEEAKAEAQAAIAEAKAAKAEAEAAKAEAQGLKSCQLEVPRDVSAERADAEKAKAEAQAAIAEAHAATQVAIAQAHAAKAEAEAAKAEAQSSQLEAARGAPGENEAVSEREESKSSVIRAVVEKMLPSEDFRLEDASKFHVDASFEGSYGKLHVFHQGLTKLIGPPRLLQGPDGVPASGSRWPRSTRSTPTASWSSRRPT